MTAQLLAAYEQRARSYGRLLTAYVVVCISLAVLVSFPHEKTAKGSAALGGSISNISQK